MARELPLGRRWNHNFHYHEELLQAMPVPARAALDVGCGDGTLLAKLALRAGRATGIDSSPLLAEPVRANAPGAEWIEADFLAHDFGARRFDFVTCVATLHHMPFAPAVRKMASLLEPGGVLAIVGLANSVTARDVAYDAMGLARSRLERSRHRLHRTTAPQAGARMSYGEVERAAAELLPGVTFRRLVLFRYSLLWRRPEADESGAGAPTSRR